MLDECPKVGMWVDLNCRKYLKAKVEGKTNNSTFVKMRRDIKHLKEARDSTTNPGRMYLLLTNS